MNCFGGQLEGHEGPPFHSQCYVPNGIKLFDIRKVSSGRSGTMYKSRIVVVPVWGSRVTLHNRVSGRAIQITHWMVKLCRQLSPIFPLSFVACVDVPGSTIGQL